MKKNNVSNGGYPDQIFMDKTTLKAFQEAFCSKTLFEAGDWALYCNDRLVEVLYKTINNDYAVRFIEQPFTNLNKIYFSIPSNLVKVPKGSNLKTVKVLYGKKS